MLELLERGAVLCHSDMPALYGDIALLRQLYRKNKCCSFLSVQTLRSENVSNKTFLKGHHLLYLQEGLEIHSRRLHQRLRCPRRHFSLPKRRLARSKLSRTKTERAVYSPPVITPSSLTRLRQHLRPARECVGRRVVTNMSRCVSFTLPIVLFLIRL